MRFFNTVNEDGKKQYTGEDYYEICIGRFNDCVDKYLVIYEMLSKRMSMERFTSSLQREYRRHFYMYTFVLWDVDVEYLKRIVNYHYPRYTEGGRPKLSEYHDPFRHLWDHPMIHSYPGLHYMRRTSIQINPNGDPRKSITRMNWRQ